MRYYATIQVQQVYEVEADNAEDAENYFRAWIRRGEPITESPDWDTLEMEEV